MSRIICAVDLSATADAAVVQALAISRRWNAELIVVHALARNGVSRWHARRRIDVIASLRRIAARDGVSLEVSVQQGNPVDVILQHAHALRPDLIIVATHGRKREDGFRRRSVAEHLATRAAFPVLVIPASAGRADTEREKSFGNVVCAVDFSAASEAAIERALSVTEGADSRLTLVHVVDDISDVSVFKYLFHLRALEHHEARLHAARRRLRRYLSRSEPHTALRACVATGDPAVEIARVAQDVQADLLVLGVRRPRLLRGRVFASTSSRLIRTSRRAVLAVPESSNTYAATSAPSQRRGVAAAL